MVFQNKNMSVIAFANGFTVWHYTESKKTIHAVDMVNFFGIIWTLMAVGDVINLNAVDGFAQLVVVKIENKKVWTKVLSQVQY